MNILVSLISSYFVLGIFAAYTNFHIVRRRQNAIEAIHRLRQDAFQKGSGIGVEFADYIQDIGIDDDEILRMSPALQSLPRVSSDQVRIILAAAFILLGPLTLFGIWRDYQALRGFEQAHMMFSDIQGKLLSR